MEGRKCFFARKGPRNGPQGAAVWEGQHRSPSQNTRVKGREREESQSHQQDPSRSFKKQGPATPAPLPHFRVSAGVLWGWSFHQPGPQASKMSRALEGPEGHPAWLRSSLLLLQAMKSAFPQQSRAHPDQQWWPLGDEGETEESVVRLELSVGLAGKCWGRERNWLRERAHPASRAPGGARAVTPAHTRTPQVRHVSARPGPWEETPVIVWPAVLLCPANHFWGKLKSWKPSICLRWWSVRPQHRGMEEISQYLSFLVYKVGVVIESIL